MVGSTWSIEVRPSNLMADTISFSSTAVGRQNSASAAVPLHAVAAPLTSDCANHSLVAVCCLGKEKGSSEADAARSQRHRLEDVRPAPYPPVDIHLEILQQLRLLRVDRPQAFEARSSPVQPSAQSVSRCA
jgi:hypothetical protein